MVTMAIDPLNEKLNKKRNKTKDCLFLNQHPFFWYANTLESSNWVSIGIHIDTDILEG